MDACAEHRQKMIVLDRPNPNGFYVDGPILDMKHKSGVGWLPIPVVHGMTLGELALMINGEKWLPQGRICDVTVIPCENYTHQTKYELPVAPSPNLPNTQSIYLYPSTCLFEGTVMSLGRGTSFPFQAYGHPNFKGSGFPLLPAAFRELRTRRCSTENVTVWTSGMFRTNRSGNTVSISPTLSMPIKT